MKTDINEETRTIIVTDDNDNQRIKICLVQDSAVWIGYENHTIVINENSDPYFYDRLKKLLSNEYSFKNESGFQDGKQIELVSDDRIYAKENDDSLSKVSKLSMQLDEENNQVYIRFINPYYDREENKEEYKHAKRIVRFLPGISDVINQESGLSIEEDMIKAITNTIDVHDMSAKTKKPA